MSLESLWDKIDPDLIEHPTSSTASNPDARTTTALSEGWWRRRARICDVIGTVFWTCALAKLFVFDFDRYLVERFAPSLIFVVNYRFFVLLALAAAVVAFVRRSWFGVIYVGLFPAIVVLWKVPKVLYKIRSWNVLLASINAAFAMGHKFKRNFVIRAVETLTIFALLSFDGTWILILCLVTIIVSLIFHFGQAMSTAVMTSKFLVVQQRLVRRVIQSKAIRKATQVNPKLRSSNIVKFDNSQIQLFAVSVSAGVFIWKMLDIYTFLLDKYRRSAAPLFFGLTSFLWIFVQSVVALTCINLAVWKIDQSQYSGDSPALVDFAYYSISSLYSNTVPQLIPTGDVATTTNLIAALYGPILLITLLAQVLLGFRQSRDEASFAEVASEVRRNRGELEKRLEAEYEVSPEEALRRLAELSLGIGPLVSYVLTILPDRLDPQHPFGPDSG